MEAFVESIMHLENQNDRRYVVNTHVAAQGDSAAIKDYLGSLAKVRKQSEQGKVNEAEELLDAFKGGFKGLV